MNKPTCGRQAVCAAPLGVALADGAGEVAPQAGDDRQGGVSMGQCQRKMKRENELHVVLGDLDKACDSHMHVKARPM